jgi:hypothetical protein
MPNQPPSERTRAKSGHSSPEFWILTSDFWILPNYTKRTQSAPVSSSPRWPKVSPGAPGNPIYHSATIGQTKNAKRTQSQRGQRPKCAKRTLNITHAKGVPPLYLTPTEVGATPTAKKCKTNPISSRWLTQKMRNEPNPRIPPVPPTPISTKRTQFAPPYTIRNIQYTIPWPNSHIREIAPTPISAKRPSSRSETKTGTQFTVSLAYRRRRHKPIYNLQ